MKRKRARKAKNKIQGALEGALIKAEPESPADVPSVVRGSPSIVLRRSTIFTTELEGLIDLIARERVRRAMLAGLGRRLLMAPAANDDDNAAAR